MKLVFWYQGLGAFPDQTADTAERAFKLATDQLSDGLIPWLVRHPTFGGVFLRIELPFDTTVKKTIFNVKIGDKTIADWYGVKEGPTKADILEQIRQLLDKLEAL